MNISTIYKRACLSFLLVAVVLIFQPCLASGSTQFEDACQLYLRKQYAKALPAFIACLKTDPRNASAYMYVANCYYLLGDKGSATQTYGIIVKGFPGTAEAAAAQKFLTNQQIGKDASSQGAAATRPSSASQPSWSPSSFAPSVTVATPEIHLSDIVHVVRPLQDHPPVSSALIDAVKEKLESYPKSVKKLFKYGGIQVYLTTTLIDKNPELKNREGRGYDGFTFKSCPGMFTMGRDIVICERTIDEGSEQVKSPLLTSEILETLNHESGHAIDHCLGDISTSDEFKHAYLLDRARIDPEDRNTLAYYLQLSDAGQEECCGELIGIILGSQGRHTEKMRAAFPQTIKLLQSKLGGS